MTDKERLELIVEYLKRDIKFNRDLEKLYADARDYDSARKYQIESTVEGILLSFITDDDFLKGQVQILRQDEEYEKQLRGINNEDHN